MQDGLGSLLLLAALERNGAEGAPGTLVSIDPLPNAGERVPERLRGGWERVVSFSPDAIEGALAGREVDLLLVDSGGVEERELAEYEAALEHAGPALLLIAASEQQTAAFASTCARLGLPPAAVQDAPHRHFYPGARTGAALVRRAAGGKPAHRSIG